MSFQTDLMRLLREYTKYSKQKRPQQKRPQQRTGDRPPSVWKDGTNRPDPAVREPDAIIQVSTTGGDHFVYHVQHGRMPWLHKVGIGQASRVDKWQIEGWTVLGTINTRDDKTSRYLESQLLAAIRAVPNAMTSERLLDIVSMKGDGRTEMFDAAHARLTLSDNEVTVDRIYHEAD